MNNNTIADQFSLLARIMTLHEENPFKIRSYSNAAFQIDHLSAELSEMSPEEMSRIPGIGSAIQNKITTLLDSGHFPLLEKYIEQTPKGIIDMLGIKGIGPKKLAVIWKKLGIETPGELLYACDEDQLTRYKGFGQKTQENIRKAVDYYLRSRGYYLYSEAIEYTNQLLEEWTALFGREDGFIPTGEVRRQMNTLSSLEFVTNIPIAQITAGLPEIFRITAEDDHHARIEKENHPVILLHYATPSQTGSALFETTGTTEFVQSFYSKYPETKAQDFASEEALFDAAGTGFIAAARRESYISGILPSPHLIQPQDIRGIIHSHSTWSDGKNSIEEMALAAIAMKMEYLVISDHSRSAGYAHGLQTDRIIAQQKEIDELNRKLAPFKIFKSIESDILSDGSLDYEDEILETFDLVIASVHSNLKMDKQKAMQRLTKAITNPYTTILGHPTGRLLLSREGYSIDHTTIIDTCIQNNVAIEINAHPRRLDLDWQYIPYALQNKAMLSIDPDAHSTQGMEYTKYGVWSAQKGGLTPANNLSSFSLEAFESYIAGQKEKRVRR